jgi:hypothetical protein
MDLFHLVEEIVSLAPRISGWRFLSLKPPQGFKFTTEYEGVLFDPSSMWFFPLENRSQPEDLGLRIGVPDFLEENKQQMLTAVLIILETALGERSAAQEIQHVEVCELPKNPERYGYIELVELPGYITWRKNIRKSQ